MLSTGAITDSSANPVERYTYDVYGFVTVTDGSFNPIAQNSWNTPHSAIGNPYTFTGRQLDEETGLYYYRARMYDPEKGRFLQRDPLDYTDSMNLYQYGLDNPTKFGDPFGLDAGQYAGMSKEELLKLWEKLVYSRPRLEILAGLDPESSFAKKYGYTPDKIKAGKEELERVNRQIAELGKELDNRQAAEKKAAQACPVAPPGQKDPCGLLWAILQIATEYDVTNQAIQSIEAIATIGTLGAYGVAKPAVAAGTGLTKEAVKKWLVAKLRELPDIIALKGGRALLNNVLDPANACFALAECETTKKGNVAGHYTRFNALGRVIRECTWNNGTANWHKVGLRDFLPRWLGGY
jgi:RHS repeat-associated protein